MNGVTIEEGAVCLRFERDDLAAKYDVWAFYRDAFQHVAGGSRGVDGVCVSGGDCWLIEIKSLTRRVGEDPSLKITDTIQRAATQVRDTLAGLAVARVSAKGAEKDVARAAFGVHNWRVAMHLEQSDRTSRMHPTPYDLADATQKLRQQVHPVDPQAVVVDASGAKNRNNSVVPWTSAAR